MHGFFEVEGRLVLHLPTSSEEPYEIHEMNELENQEQFLSFMCEANRVIASSFTDGSMHVLNR